MGNRKLVIEQQQHNNKSVCQCQNFRFEFSIKSYTVTKWPAAGQCSQNTK